MSVMFNEVPGNIRVPFLRIEVNAGQSPYQSISRLLLMGQMLSDGSAEENKPVLVTGSEQRLFGNGSQLAYMYAIARKNAPFQEIWCLPLKDVQNATKASAIVPISGAAPVTTPGSIVLYIDGFRVSVPVDTTMTQQDILAALIDAINGCPYITVTASVSAAGTRAHGTVTLTGTATGDGYASLTVDGETFQVAVKAGDTPATVAAKLADAINASSAFDMSATVAANAVTYTADSAGTSANSWTVANASTAPGLTLASTAMSGGVNAALAITANNAGTLGNGIGVYTRLANDDGPFADEMLSGVNVSLSNGAGDPNIATGIAGLGDEHWDFVVNPYCASAYLDELDQWFASRWGPMAQSYGTYYTALVNKTPGEIVAFTATRNGQFGSMLPMYNSPQGAYIIAAAYGAQAAKHLQDAPELSRPLQTVQLLGVRPPKDMSDRWSVLQRQTFYFAGASGYTVDKGGNVLIDRAVTFYTTDAYGNPDQSWLDVNTLAQLMYGLRYIMQYLSETYPRCALVGSNPANLQGFVTPQDLANGIVHAYTGLVDLGVFQDVETFQSLLIVEQNSQDPNRVDCYLPVEAVNALRVLAINATSFLKYPNA